MYVTTSFIEVHKDLLYSRNRLFLKVVNPIMYIYPWLFVLGWCDKVPFTSVL